MKKTCAAIISICILESVQVEMVDLKRQLNAATAMLLEKNKNIKRKQWSLGEMVIMLLKLPSPTIKTDLLELSVPHREQLYRLYIKVTTAANATTTWNIRHP